MALSLGLSGEPRRAPLFALPAQCARRTGCADWTRGAHTGEFYEVADPPDAFHESNHSVLSEGKRTGGTGRGSFGDVGDGFAYDEGGKD
jgi:hypothetical protein